MFNFSARFIKIINLLINSFTKLLIPCLKMTIPLTVLSFFFGLLLAMILALVQVADIKGLKQFARFYVWIFRGTPLMLQLFIIFFGLPSFGINFNGFTSAVVAFSLNLAAYNSEIIRSAIQAVPIGQSEAGYMIGLNYFQIMTRIVLPQAARVAFPPLFSSLIGLTKDTSLASTATVVEMMSVAKRIAAVYYEPFWMYMEAGFIYLMICTILTKLQSFMEKKLEWKQPSDTKIKAETVTEG
ncbi:MAG: amino acid ABC transporter permease [Erysipelotrichaceae bacterium]|nr:amino acid ABC transporter permease [Erysipelotrichaceae bacterium]MBR2533887.1 amino acid ABC transporter permease [Erysipelotrichaceae bacterium]MBR6232655.1 amino acid ABC transporter permease [Erysipelotrichaceae bacterium]